MRFNEIAPGQKRNLRVVPQGLMSQFDMSYFDKIWNKLIRPNSPPL